MYLAGGQAVTVTAESGVFTATCDFDATNNPALVEITLIPNTTHHLTVTGRVKAGLVDGCPAGGYTRSTSSDRAGRSLVIVRQIKE